MLCFFAHPITPHPILSPFEFPFLTHLTAMPRSNIHVIRMQCPWLVRYVVFALVTLGKLDE